MNDEEIYLKTEPCRVHGKDCIEFGLKIMKLAREDELKQYAQRSPETVAQELLEEKEKEIQKLKERLAEPTLLPANYRNFEELTKQNKKLRDALNEIATYDGINGMDKSDIFTAFRKIAKKALSGSEGKE